ncbi:MAG: hypothetical protein WBG08_07950 [Litorimonas sp.]
MKITYLRVAVAIARLDDTHNYRRASSPDAAYLHQLGAAQRHGVFEPFDAEARELNAWLSSVGAGRQLCRDAWDLFMDNQRDVGCLFG